MDIQNYDEGDQDVSCDSRFMLGFMDELGNATLIAYCSILFICWWITREVMVKVNPF